jgi:hypothetical protein
MGIETIGGIASESDTFAKMIEHLRQAQECAYLIGHLRKANDDKLTGQGWIAVGEMLKLTIHNVTKLATGKAISSVGYRQ